MKRRTRMRKLNLFLIVCLLSTFLPVFGTAALADSSGTGGGTVSQEVYAVSQDGSTKLKMNYVNYNVNNPTQLGNYIALYTSGTSVSNIPADKPQVTDAVYVKSRNIAIQVDAQGVVLKVVGPVNYTDSGVSPANWDPDQNVAIPAGGYVMIASDGSWNGTPNYRKPLFQTFKVGHQITLQKGGVTISPADLLVPKLSLTTQSGTTVTTATANVEGKIVQYAANNGLTVKVGEADATIQAEGTFSQSVSLANGANTISVKLYKNAVLLEEKSLILAYQPPGDLIEVEAPPADITIVVEGPKKKIDYIDKDVTGISNIIALYTSEYGTKITIPQFNVAIKVGADGKVAQMVNPANGTNAPSWIGPTDLDIPQGGYVIMAQDSSYATYDIKKYLATKFKVGDIVKLRKNGNVVPVSDLMTGLGALPRLLLDGIPLFTTKDTSTTVTGTITNSSTATLTIGGNPVTLPQDGKFSYPVRLTEGPNYIDVVLKRGSEQLDKKSIVVYSKPSLPETKQVILWVDQASNARKLQSSKNVLDFLRNAKDAGVTDIAFDVKGVEGFVSYKNSNLTSRPYVSEMTAPERRGSNPNMDLLQEFITHGKELGLKTHAAFNIFAEGSIAVKDFALIDDHLDWEERVFRPEDNGQILRLRESDYGKKGLSGSANGAQVLFVNPSNDEVRDFELKTVEEVIKNYDVDGVILDRARYDNETADFSDLTKGKFEAFLQKRGKQLQNWPDDVYKYSGNARVFGPLIQDWWEFRSSTIQSFVKNVHDMVEGYEASKNTIIQTSAYVGSWFESYYLNGVHWGSKDFRYDSRLGFPNDSVYTQGYYDTGYIDYLDFLMVGTYYGSTQEIQRYLTIDTIVTNGQVPIYAGMDLTKLQSQSLQKEIFQNAMGSSNGLMLFDASLANWPIIKASIHNQDYVKDYQIGISKPGDPQSFVEASYYNVSRNNNDINVYNEEFGTSTGANKFGVEVVVDATGKVTRVANKTQASTWNWTVPDDNNSVIPAGGMVISAIDDSGIRTRRQQIANTYSVGDDIRSAALSGFMAYDGSTVSSASLPVTGNVKVMGTGTAQVKLNGVAATVASNGDFTGNVKLQPGANSVEIAVYVDGKKTNAKTVHVTYVQTNTGDPGTTTPSGGTSNGSQGTGTTNPALTAEGVVLSGTVTQTKDENGNAATQVTLDAAGLRQAAEALAKHGGKGRELIVKGDGNAPVTLVTLPAQSLAEAAQAVPGAILTIQSGTATYRLPADLIDIQALAGEMGVKASDLQLTIKVDKKSGAEREAIAGFVQAAGGEMLGDAYAFTVTAKAGNADREVSDFGNRYITRTITLPAALVDGHATAVSIDPQTGELTFVPATFVTKDGTTTANIKRNGNSTYAIISMKKSFADIAGHWAKADIEQLASKLLVKGVTDRAFAPEQAVTRAEFSALLVRSLGLEERPGEAAYSDVSRTSWYAGAVGAASAAGLIQGYEDGKFRPDAAISREELAVLAARALTFMNDAAQPTGSDAVLGGFADRGAIAGWAQSAASIAVKAGLMNGVTGDSFEPQSQTTRAQAAVMLKRLLLKLELID